MLLSAQATPMMPRYIGLLTAMAILLGAMLWRPARGCMLSNDPEPPPKHATPWDEPYDPDLEFLKESKVATDGPGLLKYLAERSGHDDDLLRVDELIRQLGSADFQTRRQAAEKLMAVGPPAHARLLEAQKDKDPERARGARQTAEAINRAWNFGLNLTVVRRLVKLALEASGGRGSSRAAEPGSAGASPCPGGSGKREGDVAQFPLAPGGRGQGEGEVARGLLQFLPYAADEECEEEMWFGLDSIAKAQPQLVGVFADSLKDKLPIRRAVAGYLFSRRGNADQRAAGKKLLADPDPLVRLRTAQGLLGAKDKDAIPVLIELLEKLRWTEEAWQAEEMLHYVAGDEAPEPTIGAGLTEARQKCRKAWQEWWEQNSPRFDLNVLLQAPRRPGLVLLRTIASDTKEDVHSLQLIGCDGRVRWKANASADDFHLLPNDRILISQFPFKRHKGLHDLNPAIGTEPVPGVSERDFLGNVLWRYNDNDRANPCLRMPNGNTFIVTSESITEIKWDGQAAWSVPLLGVGDGWILFTGSLRLPSGNILARRQGANRLLGLVEYEPRTLREIKKINLTDPVNDAFIALGPDGNFLISAPSRERVIKVNTSGHTVWTGKVETFGKVIPLRTGNFLAVCPWGLIEVNERGEWEWHAFLLDPCFEFKPCLALVRLGFDWPRPGNVNLASSVAYWTKNLKSRHVRGQLSSARKLEEFGPKAAPAVPALIKALTQADPSVRSTLESALQKVGTPAVPLLVEAVRSADPTLRSEAAWILHAFPSEAKSIIPVLSEAMHDPVVEVRRMAATGLGGMKHDAKSVVPILVLAVQNEQEDDEVRLRACHSLGRFGRDAKPAVPSLLRCLTSKSARVGDWAGMALGMIGREDPSLVPALIDALKDDQVSGAAAGALGQIGPEAKAAVPGLIALVKSNKGQLGRFPSTVRETAVRSLGAIGEASQPAVPILVDILKSENLETNLRVSAAVALANIKPVSDETRTALREIAKQDNHLGHIAGQQLRKIEGRN